MDKPLYVFVDSPQDWARRRATVYSVPPLTSKQEASCVFAGTRESIRRWALAGGWTLQWRA